MNNALSFLHGQPDESNNSLAQLWHVLSSYRDQLNIMRTMFLYEMNLRGITLDNITYCDNELRNIMKGIDNLRYHEHIYQFIESVDEFLAILQKIQLNLYTAAEILAKRATIKEKRTFYQLLQECPGLFSSAIACFTLE